MFVREPTMLSSVAAPAAHFGLRRARQLPVPHLLPVWRQHAGITIGASSTRDDATYGLNKLADLGAVVRKTCPAWCMNAWCYVDRYNCNMPTA